MLSALRLLCVQTVKVSSLSGLITRPICTTGALKLKQIQVQQEGSTTTIEGVYVDHPRSAYLVQTDRSESICTVCATGLDIKHTDVLILSQFVRPDGCMLPRRITGLCRTQQRRVGTMVTMAQKAGLMPNLTPANSKQDPQRRHQWKKFNTYFDEATIGVRHGRVAKF